MYDVYGLNQTDIYILCCIVPHPPLDLWWLWVGVIDG